MRQSMKSNFELGVVVKSEDSFDGLTFQANFSSLRLKKPIRNVVLNRDGSIFLAIDAKGDILFFNVKLNKFRVLREIQAVRPVISFSPVRQDEVLIPAKSSVICFDILRTRRIHNLSSGKHMSPVISTNYHPIGKYAVSTSQEKIVLWNMGSFKVAKTIFSESPSHVGFTDASFSPLGKYLILNLSKVILLLSFPETNKPPKIVAKITLPEFHDRNYPVNPNYRSSQFSPNESHLVTCTFPDAEYGFSIFVLYDTLHLPSYTKIVKMWKIKTAGNMRFINDNYLAFLTPEGNMRIFDVRSNIVVYEMNKFARIRSFDVSYDMLKLVVFLESQIVYYYQIKNLIRHFEKLQQIGLASPKFKKNSSVKYVTEIKEFFKRANVSALSYPGAATDENGDTLLIHFGESQMTRKLDEIREMGKTDDGKIGVYHIGGKSSNVFTFDRTKFQEILEHRGRFDGSKRKVIWKILLQLPQNKRSFSKIRNMPPENSSSAQLFLKQSEFVRNYHNLFRVKRSLERTRKIMVYLSSVSLIYSLNKYIPEIIYPFVRIYGPDYIVIFEIILTFFNNWGKRWFEFYPNHPHAIISVVEKILETNDATLYEHLKSVFESGKQLIGTEVYCWKMLRNLYTEILSSEQWMVLFDHVFAHEPIFFYVFNVALLIYFREKILGISDAMQMDEFFEPENLSQFIQWKDFSAIIQFARELTKGNNERPRIFFGELEKFEKLPKGEYPIFVRFPKVIVEEQVKKGRRKEIAKDEHKILRRRVKTKRKSNPKKNRERQLEEFLLKQNDLERGFENDFKLSSRRKRGIDEDEKKYFNNSLTIPKRKGHESDDEEEKIREGPIVVGDVAVKKLQEIDMSQAQDQNIIEEEEDSFSMIMRKRLEESKKRIEELTNSATLDETSKQSEMVELEIQQPKVGETEFVGEISVDLEKSKEFFDVEQKLKESELEVEKLKKELFIQKHKEREIKVKDQLSFLKSSQVERKAEEKEKEMQTLDGLILRRKLQLEQIEREKEKRLKVLTDLDELETKKKRDISILEQRVELQLEQDSDIHTPQARKRIPKRNPIISGEKKVISTKKKKKRKTRKKRKKSPSSYRKKKKSSPIIKKKKKSSYQGRKKEKQSQIAKEKPREGKNKLTKEYIQEKFSRFLERRSKSSEFSGVTNLSSPISFKKTEVIRSGDERMSNRSTNGLLEDSDQSSVAITVETSTPNVSTDSSTLDLHISSTGEEQSSILSAKGMLTSPSDATTLTPETDDRIIQSSPESTF